MALLPGRLRQSTQESAEKNRGKGNENCKEKKIKNNKKRKNVKSRIFRDKQIKIDRFLVHFDRKKIWKIKKRAIIHLWKKKESRKLNLTIKR